VQTEKKQDGNIGTAQWQCTSIH